MSWADCFEQARGDVTPEAIRTALVDHRQHRTTNPETSTNTDTQTKTQPPTEPPDPSPTRVVADADVLAVDCCLAGPSRAVLDELYTHSWITLVASDQLLDDAETVIETVASQSVAREWRKQINEWRQPVDHLPSDHPALGSAYRGGAMHVLSFDDELTSSAAGAALKTRIPISVRQPDAFRLLFDPKSLYESEIAETYPGADREPRA